MKVKINPSSMAVVTMTSDELLIIRYTLAIGVERLLDTARYMSTLCPNEYENANETATKAKAASDALEEATQKYCHTPTLR